MQKNNGRHLACSSGSPSLIVVLLLALGPAAIVAQTETGKPYDTRRNTFGAFIAYSSDSSHMLLGNAENRQLFHLGVTYNRRLFVNRKVYWQYSGELIPVALESDPTSSLTVAQTSPTQQTSTYDNQNPLVTCSPVVIQYSYSLNGVMYDGTQTYTCSGRRWTDGEAISPIGFQWNFRPEEKIQPFVDSHGGYMYSTQPIPIAAAGSFNFTFDIGVGAELFRSHTRSIRAEYRYHHISNHNTATANPGIDNGLFQVTYTFGR